MPRANPSGTRYLNKLHTAECRARRQGHGRPTACRCPWYLIRYKGHTVPLEKWSDETVDPRELGRAREIRDEVVGLIDKKEFDPAGRQKTKTSGRTFTEYIDDWWIDYVEEQELSTVGLKPMVDKIKRGLGATALHDLALDQVETWLKKQRRDPDRRPDGHPSPKWSRSTYNEYLRIINGLLDRAVERRILKYNPARAIKRLGGEDKHLEEHRYERIDEDIEKLLFEKATLLNRTLGQSDLQPRHAHRKLTQAIADAIRTAHTTRSTPYRASVAALAKTHRVSRSTIIGIVTGRNWKPGHQPRVSTTGTEMERRLIAVFDIDGPRRGEMQDIRIEHIDWKHPAKLHDKATGQPFNGYEIVLPPALTKGGKVTGETQSLYAGTLRASRMLEARRFQLKTNPREQSYIFGTEAGFKVQSFRKAARRLFELAGLSWGRAKGITWHLTRAEFITRVAEKFGVLKAQQVARHKGVKTTQRYFRSKRDSRWEVAAGLRD